MLPRTLGRRGFRAFTRLALLGSLCLAAGCGGRTATVSGDVKYNGKPVTGGKVIFRPADEEQNTVIVDMDANGHYEAVVPVGEVRIAVDNRELYSEPFRRDPPPVNLKPLPPSAAPTAPSPNAPAPKVGTYVPIPEKYYTVETSELQYAVKSGSQTHNIDLR